jgi:hypothetical protein
MSTFFACPRPEADAVTGVIKRKDKTQKLIRKRANIECFLSIFVLPSSHQRFY